MIPAWDDNAFSGSSAGPGDGLTAEGFKLIELCQELGVMVDVSHASDAAFEQIRRIVRGPFVASHSNCRALSPAPRNLTDAQIRALADRGGVMGINLAPDFLSPDYLAAWDAVMAPAHGADAATRQKLREAAGPQLRAIPLPGLEWIARHVRHAINIGGEACIGLGGDLDGISFMPAGINGVEGYPLIPEALAAAGLTEAQIEKVCWRNMARVFGEVLGETGSWKLETGKHENGSLEERWNRCCWHWKKSRGTYRDTRIHYCRLEAAALDGDRCALAGAVLDEDTLRGVLAGLGGRLPDRCLT